MPTYTSPSTNENAWTLSQWTIVKTNDKSAYIIGINEDGEKHKTSYISNYKAIDNNFITLETEDEEIRLNNDSHFKPTYTDKKLFRWRVIDYDYNRVYSDTLNKLYDNRHNLKKIYWDKFDGYVYNDNIITKYDIEDIFIGHYLDAYRDSKINVRPLFETTEITSIKLHEGYIEVFTESGSNYILNICEFLN